MKELTSVDVKEYTNPQGYQTITARTKSLPYYGTLRDQIYWQGRQTVTSHTMKLLDSIGLAIWYLDDGWLNGKTYNLGTHNFNEAENYFIKDCFEKYLGIYSSVNKFRQYYHIRFAKDSNPLITKWVKELDVKSMMYKVLPNENLSGVSLGVS